MASPPTQRTGRILGPQARRIGVTSFGLVIALIIQFVLGLSYNLYGTMPTANRKIGILSSPLIAIHVIVGTLLVVGATSLVVRAVRSRIQLAVATSATGGLALIAAWVGGAEFTQSGGSGYSLVMGLMTAVALLCYSVNVKVFGGGGSE